MAMAGTTEGPDGAEPKSWLVRHKDVLTLALATLAFLVSICGLISGRYTDRTNRAANAVQELYGPDFSDALSHLLGYSYGFIDDEGSRGLRTNERFWAFWQGYDDEKGMLVMTSVLRSVLSCQISGHCDMETIYDGFPETVYQALFFLREFIFPRPAVVDSIYSEGLDGWYFGKDGEEFLQDYCRWAVGEYGGMGLWSPRQEVLRTSIDALPDPCDFAAP